MTMPCMLSFRRKTLPKPRQEVFDLYWIFASRRQAAFKKRLAGGEPPWTKDPIIQRFKFCNVYRAADRVSQYLIRNVAYNQLEGNEVDRLFRIVAFRTFSNSMTWDSVTTRLGHAPTLADLSSGRFQKALDAAKLARGGLYTGAFILCATKAYGFNQKHHNHVALFQHMFLREFLGERLLKAKSLAEIVGLLESFPLTGPFMSYQIAIDLNYSDMIDFNENDFTQAGPGALRGIRKAFVNLGDFEPSEVILWMVDRQDQEFQRLGLDFKGLWGRKLHAIDCQGLFCELDKYCREAVPQLPSNRKRIKARFIPSSDGLSFFFPPKWGLCSRLRKSSHEILGLTTLISSNE